MALTQEQLLEAFRAMSAEQRAAFVKGAGIKTNNLPSQTWAIRDCLWINDRGGREEWDVSVELHKIYVPSGKPVAMARRYRMNLAQLDVLQAQLPLLRAALLKLAERVAKDDGTLRKETRALVEKTKNERKGRKGGKSDPAPANVASSPQAENGLSVDDAAALRAMVANLGLGGEA